MVGDLPDLDSFFSNDNKLKTDSNCECGTTEAFENQNICIYISKEEGKWIPAEFLDIAVGGIGIHIRLPMQIELTLSEINNVKVKFVKRNEEMEEVLKEASVKVRWQEKDEITGNLKLGLHFHGEVKNDKVLITVLKLFKK